MAYITDSQQIWVYYWEEMWKWWNVQRLSKKECAKLLKWACRLYNVPAPSLKLHRPLPGKRWATAFDPSDYSITLSPQHMNEAVCLHEVAHAIHSLLTGDEAHEAHGPEWLALYIYLLDRLGLAPRIALFATAKVWRLKWKDLDKHNPLRIRKTYARLRRKEKLDT